MKLSQAVDLYIQRKRDAGMRFDSPTTQTALVSSPLWRYRSSPHHDTADHSPSSTARAVRPSGWSGKRGTLRSLFRLLDSAWSAEDPLPLPPSAPKITPSFVPYIYSRSDLRSASGCCPTLPTEIGLRHVGSNLPHAVAVSVRNWHAARRSTSAPGHGPGSDVSIWLRYAIRSFTSHASCLSDRISRGWFGNTSTSAGTTKSTLSTTVSRRRAVIPLPSRLPIRASFASATDRRHRASRRLVLPTEAS